MPAGGATRPTGCSRQHFAEPALSEVAADVEVSTAYFDRSRRELIFTLRRHDDRPADGTVSPANLNRAGESWCLYDGDTLLGSGRRGGEINTEATGLAGAVRRAEDGHALVCPPGAAHRYLIRCEGAAR
ncbi:MAG TPA: hypothetical protein VGH89_12800 [Pseudonocardia sp.]